MAAVGELAGLDADGFDQLVRFVGVAYPTLGLLRELGQHAGLDLLDWKQSDRMRETIPDMLRLANTQARLGALLRRILQDPGKVAIHEQIRPIEQLLQPPPVAVVAFKG